MRKPLLMTGAVAMALSFSATVVPTAAQAQTVDGPKVGWKLSLWGKRRAFTEGMEYMSEQVSKRTGGKFTIKLFYGEQLSKSKENSRRNLDRCIRGGDLLRVVSSG